MRDDFRDTEDLAGVFSGYDAAHRRYDTDTWAYATAAGQDAPEPRQDAQPREGASATNHPEAPVDLTLEDPRCVFQVLRRHFARYTPALVERACGIPPDLFAKFADAILANSGRERTTAFCYAVAWTQHTTGSQIIGCGAILQLLLGNIGRPGGGILALRGHATIQGSTDIPTLYNLLPGYIPMPTLPGHESLSAFLEHEQLETGLWYNLPSYLISLLKAWYGDAATAENAKA